MEKTTKAILLILIFALICGGGIKFFRSYNDNIVQDIPTGKTELGYEVPHTLSAKDIVPASARDLLFAPHGSYGYLVSYGYLYYYYPTSRSIRKAAGTIPIEKKRLRFYVVYCAIRPFSKSNSVTALFHVDFQNVIFAWRRVA